MSADVIPAVAALSRRYLLDYPREAARQLEKIAPDDAAALLAPLPPNVVLPVWQALTAGRRRGDARGGAAGQSRGNG